MKKIILLLGILFIANSAAVAKCEYECVAPYDMNSKFKTFTSAISGYNSMTEKVAESVMKKEILKVMSAEKLKFDIESYSPKDLKRGIFKSMYLSGQNVVINDISLSTLELKSLCDFNYVQSDKNGTIFKEAFPMSFSLSMTDENLDETIKTDQYQKLVNDLNNLGKNYAAGIQISSTKATIKHNKFFYVIGFDIPFVKKEQRIVIQSDMRVKNGKIDLCNTRIVAGHFNLDMRKIDFIMRRLNPLDFSVNILKDKNAKVIVKNVDLAYNKIVADGIIIIPKD